VSKLMPGTKAGDHDPLDICVISERAITHPEVILKARIVGGLPMHDNGEADDKIIAVLESDNMWQDVKDVSELPKVMVDRLRHYFSTYKMLNPDDAKVTIPETYGREHAEQVVAAAMVDYREQFGE
jgi:inorganic pyrophosphatase